MKKWSLYFLLTMCFSASSIADEKRIISTDAGATALLLAFDMGKNLVGVDVTSELPETYKNVPRVGYHRQLSAEGLLSLSPSMVVGSEHMGPPSVLTALQKADIKLLQLPMAYKIPKLQEQVLTLARELGCESCAVNVLKNLEQQQNKLDQSDLSKQRIIFLMNMDQRSMRYAGTMTGGDALISLVNGVNIAEHEGYRNLSLEGLLAINPDVILVSGRDDKEDAASVLKDQYPVLLNKKIINVDGRALVAGLSILTVNEALRISQ